MSGTTEGVGSTLSGLADQAGGQRNVVGSALPPSGVAETVKNAAGPGVYAPEGFTKEDIKNMGGSLKVHVRLAIEIDIRVTAKIKGDICIGIL